MLRVQSLKIYTFGTKNSSTHKLTRIRHLTFLANILISVVGLIPTFCNDLVKQRIETHIGKKSNTCPVNFIFGFQRDEIHVPYYSF